MKRPGFKGALLELIDEAAQRLAVHAPVGEQDLQRIVSDRLFLQRLEAMVTAVLPW